MASKYLPEMSGMQEFNVIGDASGLAQRWKRWIRSFQLYAAGRGVTNAEQKKSLLLHCAGMSVQDIFFTLTSSTEGADVYAKAVNTLEDYFVPQANVPYERHTFRQLAQQPSETIEQFITRLRQKAETCEFANKDEQIRDQVIEKCISSRLRRKLLEKGKDLTLDDLRTTARTYEEAESQAKKMEQPTQATSESINKLYAKGKPRHTASVRMDIECYRCGYKGHTAKDSRCPAKDKRCRKCKNIGHFEKKCKSGRKVAKPKKGVRTVNEDDNTNEDVDYTFSVHRKYPESTTIKVMIGGIEIPMIIDSGSTSNIVDRETWEYLKKQGIECRNQKRSKDLYAYGSKEALSVAGLFWTKVEYQENRLDEVEFVVIEGKGQSLLSCETAIQLGVLKIVRNIEGDTSNAEAILEEHQDVFEGIGKLKDYQLKIPIDNDVEPVVQATRRVPFNLRDKLSQKLDELEAKDIIERVDGPTTWVSPVVIVPKPNGDIRLCLDMRNANSAVKHVRHPIPTVDQVLQEINESKVFSKHDISMA